eukprot:3936872-Rhodomonas_salina.6
MVYFKVPELAQTKIDDATLHQMVVLYKDDIEKSLVSKIAAFVGGVGEDRSEAVVKHRAQLMFNQARGDAAEVSYAAFVRCLDQNGITDPDDDEVEELMFVFDDNDNGTLDLQEFEVCPLASQLPP